jgi:WD40 repeat protein
MHVSSPIREQSGASHSSRNLDTDASLGELEGDLAADAALTDTYKFGRAYHLFTEHTKAGMRNLAGCCCFISLSLSVSSYGASAVPTVRFANQNRDLLAFASLDGSITISSAASHPTVLRRLQEHTRGVTGTRLRTAPDPAVLTGACVSDFDWSCSNEWILSGSLDGSLRVWDASAGKCLRILYDEDGVGACRFHPVNNNAVVVRCSRHAGNTHTRLSVRSRGS